VNIVLSCREAELAVWEGGRRRLRRIYGKASGDLFQRAQPFDRDVEGVGAELAVARYLNLYWTPSEGAQPPTLGDVGEFEVRWTAHEDGHLTVRSNTPDARKCVLVVGRIPEFRICGWMLAGDAKQGRYRREFENARGRLAGFWVPQGDLHSFEQVAA